MGRQAEKTCKRDLPFGNQILRYCPLSLRILLPTYVVSHRDTTGEPHTDKIKRLQEELKSKKNKAMVLNMLDEVAWLLNLRGSDIDFNPVFFAYSVVSQDKVVLFVDPSQINDNVRKHLGEDIEIKSYDKFFEHLKGLGAELELSKAAVCRRHAIFTRVLISASPRK